ncbi:MULTISPECIES: WbqC family protein [unclassified Carboxylicivirga]|uniref:WbqC family protein n=1 Tax=Carboxylicivirga TaxID=1628153 RepID=UPI003D33E630
MPQTKLIPLTYLGPIQLYAHILNSKQAIVEQHARYQRKTYCNHCTITGANGPLKLTVPVAKAGDDKTLIKDMRISYDTQWQKQHWRSIVAAYNSSPFFEYYADDFVPFYEKKIKYLIDLNMGLMNTLFDELEVDIEASLSEQYYDELAEDTLDLRRAIHPKVKPTNDLGYQTIEYRQVFAEKYPFVPNLSVIDLLFSKGPETYDILEASIL